MKTRIMMAFLMAAGLCIGGARVASAHCPVSLCVGGAPNGSTTGSEQCDDNNNSDCDGCHTDCSLNLGLCGDCHACGGEACDDGNSVNTDNCNNACTSNNQCGNGFTDAAKGEQCDDGDTNNCNGCTTTCKSNACGDNFVCGAEVCDDGNTVFCDSCNGVCNSNNQCGNSITDGACGEACDDGNTDNCSDACSQKCKAPTCGDGYFCPNGPLFEVCDDGNTAAGGACNANCSSNNSCGNGITDTGVGEECDNKSGTCSPGNPQAGTSCTSKIGTANCYTAGGACIKGSGPLLCCDAFLAGAQLAGGNTFCDGACDATTITFCPFDPGCTGISCGACNNDYNANACRSSCQAAGCGDGVADAGEQCDDGARNDGLDDADSCVNGAVATQLGIGCRASSRCGDSSPRLFDSSGSCSKKTPSPACGTNCQTGTEQCDAGNGQACINGAFAGFPKRCLENPTQICVSDSAGCTCGNVDTANHCRDTVGGGCTVPVCGDGITDSSEECDDGNTVNDVTCQGDCTLPGCGDGVTVAPEVCDDGNTNNCDACTVNCKTPACGDTFICTPETCDDGNLLPNDNCSPGCLVTSCGDGVVNTVGCQNNAGCPAETCGNSPEQCDPGICGDNPGANCSGGCCLWDATTSGAPPSPGASASLAALSCCLADLQALTIATNVGGLAPRVQKIRDKVSKKLPGSTMKKTCSGVRSVSKKIAQLARKIDIAGATSANQQALQDNRARCARWDNRYGDINQCTPVF